MRAVSQDKWYDAIDEALRSYEEFKPYHDRTIDWICDRIDWCWKWRRITKEEMEELADRVVKVLEGDL